MGAFPASLENLVEKFASLPGIGRKSAQRMAFYVLDLPDSEAESFARAILDAKKNVHCCPICQNLTDAEICPICSSPVRDTSMVCVVADPKDVAAIERTGEYRGTYHVLHGVLSPLNQIGPNDIRIRELVERVADGGIEEVILATNPDTEGETTARYISRLIRPFGVTVSRLACGMPAGSSLEFTDEATLLMALDGRQEMSD